MFPWTPNGNPIPLERQQPQRILGFMPNFRSVSGGSKPHPPGWKYNFTVATHQATDYSTFIFLGLTSLTAEGTERAPQPRQGRGRLLCLHLARLPRQDRQHLSLRLAAALLLHEDTRFYALGAGHSIPIRAVSTSSAGKAWPAPTAAARHPTSPGSAARFSPRWFRARTTRPAQPASLSSPPSSATPSCAMSCSPSIREFYPDAAAHFIRKHREKMARLSAQEDAAARLANGTSVLPATSGSPGGRLIFANLPAVCLAPQNPLHASRRPSSP